MPPLTHKAAALPPIVNAPPPTTAPAGGDLERAAADIGPAAVGVVPRQREQGRAALGQRHGIAAIIGDRAADRQIGGRVDDSLVGRGRIVAEGDRTAADGIPAAARAQHRAASQRERRGVVDRKLRGRAAIGQHQGKDARQRAHVRIAA